MQKEFAGHAWGVWVAIDSGFRGRLFGVWHSFRCLWFLWYFCTSGVWTMDNLGGWCLLITVTHYHLVPICFHVAMQPCHHCWGLEALFHCVCLSKLSLAVFFFFKVFLDFLAPVGFNPFTTLTQKTRIPFQLLERTKLLFWDFDHQSLSNRKLVRILLEGGLTYCELKININTTIPCAFTLSCS